MPANPLRRTEAITRTVPPRIFVPPAFDLYEFVDRSAAVAQGPTRRWFSGWNGLIGAPAQNVTLGWSAENATVLVCTEGGDSYRDDFGRLIATHLALGGTDLPLPIRGESVTAINREIERIMSSDELWSPIPAIVPGGPEAQSAALDGFSIAHCMLGEVAAFVAAVGVGPDRFRIRKVQDWTVYDHNATTSFPLGDLSR